jgi:hypothetical protein
MEGRRGVCEETGVLKRVVMDSARFLVTTDASSSGPADLSSGLSLFFRSLHTPELEDVSRAEHA